MELRAVEADDGDALHSLFTEPGVCRFLFDGILLTREETQRHVEAAISHSAWVVCDNGRIVGLVSLRPTDDADRELMIALSERCWGKGLAFEAAQAAMRYGFDVLKLDRILASVDLPNDRSHQLMMRLGFASCGESEGPKYRLRNYEALRRSGT